MVQRVKDELQSLVLKGSVPIDPDGKILLPPSYYYEVGLRVQIRAVCAQSPIRRACDASSHLHAFALEPRELVKNVTLSVINHLKIPSLPLVGRAARA